MHGGGEIKKQYFRSNNMAVSGFIQYQNSQIHFLQFGAGKKIVFAFHGFSENAASFLALEPSLGKSYTVIAIDIPYHGETTWNEQHPFNENDLNAIVKLFIEKYHVQTFSVLGFSMGGKCALMIAKNFISSVDELFLMASDGIGTNKIYNVAVYPKWGRELFKTTIRHPTWFFILIKIANKLKLLSPWLYKFTFTHMETKEKRQRLYNTWISMAEFNPDVEKIKLLLKEYTTRVYLFFGKRDEVIKPGVAGYFCNGLPNCKLTLLDRGHYFIDEKLNPFIEQALKSE